MASKSASISLCPTCGQPKFRDKSKSNKRTNRNEVDHNRTRSWNVDSVNHRFVAIDDEWIFDAFHLMPICDVQYDTTHWATSTRVSFVESVRRRVPYRICVNVNMNTRRSPWEDLPFHMHKDIIWRVPDVQERPVRFLSLQRSILLQRARTEPILDDLAMLAELGPAWKMSQDISPTHPCLGP